MEPERLAKVLARAGVASRRKAEELILEGAVTVNGEVVTEVVTMVTPGTDKLAVRGRPVSVQVVPELYYFVVNKPKGYLCAAKVQGEDGSALVTDLLRDWVKRWRHQHPKAKIAPRLFTVGRLDVQSTGLIFVTNDGHWANSISHPSSELTKEYVVTVDRTPTRRELEIMAAGCDVEGTMVMPEAVGLEDSDPNGRSKVRVVINEGRNREVRVLVASAGLEVKAIKRVRVGGFRLPRDLAQGKYRALKPSEVRRAANKGAQATA